MKTLAFADPVFRTMPCAVTIGVFDGLHRGHLQIIGECVETAGELGCSSVAVSFNVNPKMTNGSERMLKPLLSSSDFEEILAEKGIDYHCIIDFSHDMSKLSGEEFIALLCTSYGLRAMVVGDSFRCGNPASAAGPGQIDRLLSVYTSSAFLKVVPPVLSEGKEVSSSLIRRCLLEGDTETASVLLGRRYCVDLRSCDFSSDAGRLLYKVRNLGQLLPKEGSYGVYAESAPTPGPVGCDGLAVISEDSLALELKTRTVPDRIYFL